MQVLLYNRSYLLLECALTLLLSFVLLTTVAFAQEWSQVSADTDSTLNGVYFTDRNMGWAVGNSGTIIHTSDGGDSWTNQNSRTSEQLNSVYFFDEFTGWIAGNNNLVLFTENGGEQWTERRPSSVSGQHIMDISFADWKRGWAAGGPGGHIYYTDNSGLTWQRQASVSPDEIISSLLSLDHETSYAVYGNKIVSDDNQSQWNEIQPLAESDSFLAEDLFFINDSTGWVIGNDNRSGIILQTEDGGNQWTEIERIEHSQFQSIVFADDERGIIVGTEGVILQTNNGGETWEPTGSETDKDLNDITFADPGNGWIIGEEGTLLRFLDSEIPDISYYKSIYPSIQLSNESEAVELLQRAQQYGDAALAQEDPSMRAPHYGRLLASTGQVEQFFVDSENQYASQIPTLLKHYWAIEHNEGAEIFNEWLENEGEPQQIERSKKHLQNAIAIQPDSVHSYVSLSYVNLHLNDNEGAISAMETAINLMDVPDLDHYTALIELYQSEQRLSEALEVNKKAIEEYPEEDSLYELLVNIYLDQGKVEEAVDYLTTLIERDSDSPNYYFIRGAQLQYLALNKLEEALRLYEEVWALREELQTDLAPEDRNEIENRIDSLMQEVNELESDGIEYADQAISDLEKVEELDPESYNVQGIIGSIYHNRASIFYQMRTLTADQNEAQKFDSTITNSLEEAKTHYEQAVTQDPDESTYWEALYYIYLDLGLEDQAEQIVRNEHFENT